MLYLSKYFLNINVISLTYLNKDSITFPHVKLSFSSSSVMTILPLIYLGLILRPITYIFLLAQMVFYPWQDYSKNPQLPFSFCAVGQVAVG
jgi:hypothetical protein